MYLDLLDDTRNVYQVQDWIRDGHKNHEYCGIVDEAGAIEPIGGGVEVDDDEDERGVDESGECQLKTYRNVQLGHTRMLFRQRKTPDNELK